MKRLINPQKFFFLIFMAASFLLAPGCDKSGDDGILIEEPDIYPYRKPQILTPAVNEEFFSIDMIKLSWTKSDSLCETEYQMVFLNDYYKESDKILFDTLKESGSYGRYSNYSHGVQHDISQDMYIAFRVRIKGPKGSSAWSDVRSYCVKAVNNLQYKPVHLTLQLNFKTSNSGNYYSAVVSRNINYDSLFTASGLNPQQIRLIRPVRFQLTYLSGMNNGIEQFQRFAIGFDNNVHPESAQPFDISGDSYITPSYSGGFTLYPYGGVTRNYKDTMVKDKLQFNLAYILADNAKLSQQHSMQLDLFFNVY